MEVPAATVGALTYDMLIGFGLCILGIISFGNGIDTSALFGILIVIPAFLIALGLSWFLSALGVFIRDLSQLASFLDLLCFMRVGYFTQPLRHNQPHRYLGISKVESIIANY